MTIYIDVLIAVNMYANYFLLRGTAVFLRRNISSKRVLLAAAVGALFSLVILLPELSFIVNALIRLFSGAAIVLTAFGYNRLYEFVTALIGFLTISFLYAGIMMGIWLWGAPFGMIYRNGTAYFNIPLFAVGVFTAVAYLIVRLIRRLSDSRLISSDTANIVISAKQGQVSLIGIADTGNSLCDPFSGKPVIIVSQRALGERIPSEIKEYFINGNSANMTGIRLIPCRTINGCSVLPIFKADRITVDGKITDAMIGVIKDEYACPDCIFNPKLISF